MTRYWRTHQPSPMMEKDVLESVKNAEIQRRKEIDQYYGLNLTAQEQLERKEEAIARLKAAQHSLRYGHKRPADDPLFSEAQDAYLWECYQQQHEGFGY